MSRLVACLAGLLLAGFGLVGGCADRTISVEEMREPQLRAIHAAMVRTIERAEADSTVKWHCGWTGNIAVNASETDLGLCYQWRDLIWEGVYDTVKQQGWDATGVTISRGTWLEHHGVLVWDPKVITRDQLLIRTTQSYVLDGWARGKADVYRLDQWIDDQLAVAAPPRIRELSPPGLPGSPPPSTPANAR